MEEKLSKPKNIEYVIVIKHRGKLMIMINNDK